MEAGALFAWPAWAIQTCRGSGPAGSREAKRQEEDLMGPAARIQKVWSDIETGLAMADAIRGNPTLQAFTFHAEYVTNTSPNPFSYMMLIIKEGIT